MCTSLIRLLGYFSLIAAAGMGCSGSAGSSGARGSSTGTGSGPVVTTGSGASPGGVVTTGTAGTTDSAGTTGAAGTTGSAGTTGAAGTMGPVVGPGQGIQPGSLTAGTWDDNLNYPLYQKYLRRIEQEKRIADLPNIPRADRLEIVVADSLGAGLGNATVKVSSGSTKLFEAPTRPDGRVFFFPGSVDIQTGSALKIDATYGGASATGSAMVGDSTATIAISGAVPQPPIGLDVALVIDTTGSMGDELEYLKLEMKEIVRQTALAYPNVAQRLALILYRDDGDEYVVRSFDFTSSVDAFQSQIDAQRAGGGGDWPEAPEKALSKLTTLSWNRSTAARLAFWIADAPHHAGRAGTMAQDILTAQALGIRLYPIAASGVADLLEYTMRTAAQVTGGRYLFLTDDSGIGNSHAEPTIPCYEVTSLERAMARTIATELAGTPLPYEEDEIIRTRGNPDNGVCTLSDGTMAFLP